MRKIINAGIRNYRIRFKAVKGAVTVFKENKYQLFSNSNERMLRSKKIPKESIIFPHQFLPLS